MSDGNPPGRVALSAADRSILELETGAVVGHTVKIVELAGRVTGAELAERIRQRLPRIPSLTTRLSGWPDDPYWAPERRVDVDALVSTVGTVPPTGAPSTGGTVPSTGVPSTVGTAPSTGIPSTVGTAPSTGAPSTGGADRPAAPDGLDDGGLDDDRLRSQVAELFVRPLDRARPLWHVAVAPLVGGRTAVIWRLHHALADGVTALRLAAHLFWDDTAPSPAAAPPPRPAPAVGPQRTWAHTVDSWAGAASTGAALVGFLAREIPVGGGPSPFDGAVSTARTVGWAGVSLGALRAAAHRVPGATVNDALLAAVTGGLRHWLIAHGRPATDLPIRVPVSLHTDAEAASASGGPGNADSFFTVALPIHLTAPTERLRVIAGQTRVRKDAQDARREDSMSRSLQRFDPLLGRFVDHWRTDPRRFALAVSNIPGPRQPVTVLGHAVTGLTTLAEIGERHALRVAAISCGDRLTVGFCADPAVVPDAQAMADATAAAARELLP